MFRFFMHKIFRFIDDNLLFGISLFLLVFIPLYPKWPLFDVLPGYNVRVRLEDFLVLLAFLIWGIYVLRGKIKLARIPLFKPMLIYFVIGFLSTLSAIFITKTVTTESYQVLKIFFHLFRRVEYFSLFFIFFSAVHKKEQIKVYLGTLLAAVTGVVIYGFGQKYLYWPAYSTMNREFSKGIVLYLTEHARVLSTFGGHYDLAAYIMLTLTITLALAFIVKNKVASIGALILSLAQYWLLILTASRTSFIAYLAAISATFFFLAFKKSWKWSLIRWAGVMTVTMAIMLTLGPMSERFSQVIKIDEIRNSVNRAFGPPPENGIAMREDIPVEEQIKIVASDSDAPPTPVSPKTKPDDVYVDPYATQSANIATSSATGGGYSENALKYGLSTAIRMDALWPRAMAAFQRNPLLGTGYSTLVKTKVWEQTTAESTDNDYLRLLGETGLLGFIAFLSILAVSVAVFYKAFRKTDEPLYFALFAAGIGIVIGLLFNAMYIDIFESSKVAYSMWSILGFLLALAVIVLGVNKKGQAENHES